MVIPIGFSLETDIGYVLDFTANQEIQNRIGFEGVSGI